MYDPTLALLRALASLSFTLGLLVIAAWVWRRYGQHFSAKLGLTGRGAAPQRRLAVLETQRLNQHTTLHLVQLDDTELLLSTTAAQTTLIHTTTKPKTAKVKS